MSASELLKEVVAELEYYKLFALMHGARSKDEVVKAVNAKLAAEDENEDEEA